MKHEWWVRINDTKDRAGALDYARVMAKAVRREVRPLERELQRLQLLINQRRDLPDLEGVLATLRNQEATPDASSTQEGIVAQVRRLLVKGNSQVEDGLVAEALRVAEVMGGTSENNPWLFRDMTPEKLREILSYLEEQTFPLAEALATIARYDNRGELLEGVRRAFKVIAREPQPSGIHYSYISQFRLYPLVLCIYAVVVVAVAERRRDLLKAVFELSVFHADGASSDPLVAAVRRLRAAQDVFKEATERNYIEAVAERVKEVLLPRLGPLLAGEAPADAFFVAEFVLSLAFLPVSPTYYGAATKATLPGSYFYYWDARRAVSVFLKGRPTWLGDALGEPLSDLLVDFDRAATRAIDSRAFGANGFVSGAAEAFEGKAPTP